MNKNLGVLILILLLVLTAVVIYFFLVLRSPKPGTPGGECIGNYDCPRGYTCGMKVDILPGSKGICTKGSLQVR